MHIRIGWVLVYCSTLGIGRWRVGWVGEMDMENSVYKWGSTWFLDSGARISRLWNALARSCAVVYQGLNDGLKISYSF